MPGATWSPAEERGSGSDRRAGRERRSGLERRVEPRRTTDEGHGPLHRPVWVDTGGASVPLRRLLPHARFNEREAAERAVVIAAHRQELRVRLGRDAGPSGAAPDFLLNIRRDLLDPTIVEPEVLGGLEHRSVTDPLPGLFNPYPFQATATRQ